MGTSIVRSFLIALVTASLFGTVPAAAGNEASSGSTMGVPDTSGVLAPGATLWSTRFARVGDDYVAALGVSPDGSKVFVTGSVRGSTSGIDYATVAYDASTGAKLWAKLYTGGWGTALGVSPDGTEVFVTGVSLGSTSHSDYGTVAYDASTGERLWVRRYNGPENGTEYANALGVSPDGSEVFVTGQSFGSTNGWDYATVAYDASTGEQLWAERYTRSGDSSDLGWAVGVSPDGSEVFVTGNSDGWSSGYDNDYATVSYDASTGARLWSKRYNSPANGDDSAHALGVSPDGTEVYVTGSSDGSTSGADYATVAYDASTGAKLWSTRYTRSGNDSANALGASPDGTEVYVTGSSDGSTSGADYATVAYDTSTGAKLWSTRYTRPGNDSANALGVSPDGSEVFVTGASDGSTSADYATVAYDASTGAKVWSKRYSRAGNDSGRVLGVGPDGFEVFVTGWSDGSTSGADYATVAYGVT
jgi:outer membrane protein assembly factor BamB